MSPNQRPRPQQGQGPELKDGQALDRLTERVESWARSYRFLDDPDRWDTDFAAKFEREAGDLARRATPEPRPFAARDWLLALVLWGLIAGTVWVFSYYVMQLDGTWPIIFAVFAVMIAAVGIWQSYLEVTSEKRYTEKLAKKEQWLLGVSRKASHRIFAERQAKRASS